MRAVIIDDEKHGVITLQKLLQNYCPEVEVSGVASNARDGRRLIEQVQPECVFLDVAMPGKSGLDLLQEIDRINFKIIFVTAHHHYILQALRLSAIDYLLKPVNEDELIKAVEKAKTANYQETVRLRLQTMLENNGARQAQELKITLPDFEGFHVRKVGDIIFCEADNTYTKINLVNGEVLVVSKPLLNYEELLRDFNFMRIHKSYLINMHHLRTYQKADGGFVVMTNGQRLEVSKRKKELLAEEIKNLFKV